MEVGMPQKVLSLSSIRKVLEELRLKPAIQDYLERLLALAENKDEVRVNVKRILEELFSLSTPKSANTQLKRLLKEINQAAERQGLNFRACITQAKRGGAKKRWVWFEGELPPPGPAYTSELKGVPEEQLITDQRGTLLNEPPTVILLTVNEKETQAVLKTFYRIKTENRDGRLYNILKPIGDLRLVHTTCDQGRLSAYKVASKALRSWGALAIIGVGVAFGLQKEKQKLGDVLVSQTIQDYEHAKYAWDGRVFPRGSKNKASPKLYEPLAHLYKTESVVSPWPVVHFGNILSGDKLVDNPLPRAELLKIDPEAIGGEMEGAGIVEAALEQRAFWIVIKGISDWGDGTKARKSVQEKAAQNAAWVTKRLLEALGQDPEFTKPPQGQEKPFSPHPSCEQMSLKDLKELKKDCLLDLWAAQVELKKELEPPEPSGSQVEVLSYLLDWVKDPAAPSFFALLGEYGMGKTITSQLLTKELAERRKQDPSWPLPLYFDLRHVTISENRPVPTLQEILQECMARGWLGGESYTLEDVLAWVEQGAVVIFDGLDEALVKMNQEQGGKFTHTIIKFLEETRFRAQKKGQAAKPVKMLLTCRTHYFRTLRDQINHFVSERGHLKAEDYRALVLLPLTEEQVAHYLRAAFPETDLTRLMETIESVHNLPELTRRPYTLRLVAEFIPEIEKRRSQGHPVYGVTLYRELARRWLERDVGKHQIRPEDKLKLAAHLAAYLWQRGRGSLPINDIEDWFHLWLEEQPARRARYGKIHPERLEEDLRTATFLVREDQGEESFFRFAHTSIFEYFLAEYLFQALKEEAPKRWDLKTPSLETLDFLGQILAEAEDPTLLQKMTRWGQERAPLRNRLLLAYTLRALEKGWPVPSLKGLVLAGKDLEGFYFRGFEHKPLDLNQADLSGANLRRVVFEHVLLKGANFAHAKLAQAEFLHCSAEKANWQGAECLGTLWRECKLQKSSFGENTGQGKFLLCQGLFPGAKAVLLREGSLVPITHPAGEMSLRWLTGHKGGVLSCSWAPDGRYVVSGGSDRTLRVWDVEKGEEVLCLRGHEGGVSSCSWSPEGKYVVSGGDDGTLRVWDLEKGKELLCLRGH